MSKKASAHSFSFVNGHFCCDSIDLGIDFCPKVTDMQRFYDANGQLLKSCFIVHALSESGELKAESKWWTEDFLHFDYRKLNAKIDIEQWAKTELNKKLRDDIRALHAKNYLLFSSKLNTYQGQTYYVFYERIFPALPANVQEKISLPSNEGEAGYVPLRLPANLPPITEVCICDYINLMPGISEILFYASLYGPLKPILRKAGIRTPSMDFALGIFAPSGHLKTGLVTKYALFASDRNAETFQVLTKKKLYETALSKLSAPDRVNVLVDDLRPFASPYAKNNLCDFLDDLLRRLDKELSHVNVFITGEDSYCVHLFSGKDRMLQLTIPQMTDNQIRIIKRKLANLPDKGMPAIAMNLVAQLMDHFDQVLDDIERQYKELCHEVCDKENGIAFPVRFNDYAVFIYLTEFLVRKYLLNGSRLESYEENLHKALDKQLQGQLLDEQIRHALDHEGGTIPCILSLFEGDSGILTRFEVDHQATFDRNRRQDYTETEERAYMVDDKNYYIKIPDLLYGLQTLFRTPIKKAKILRDLEIVGAIKKNGNDYTRKYQPGRVDGVGRVLFICKDALHKAASGATGWTGFHY